MEARAVEKAAAAMIDEVVRGEVVAAAATFPEVARAAAEAGMALAAGERFVARMALSQNQQRPAKYHHCHLLCHEP